MRHFLTLVVLVACILATVGGFQVVAPRPAVTRAQVRFTTAPVAALYLSQRDDDDQEVNVNIVEDVDPLTLTAIGFAAIAINFLIFANMGDAGLSGFVARLINFANS